MPQNKLYMLCIQPSHLPLSILSYFPKLNSLLLDTGPLTSDTWFTDTTVALGQTYYYRVTGVDNSAPWENESFFSPLFMVQVPAFNTAALKSSETKPEGFVPVVKTKSLPVDTKLFASVDDNWM